MFIHPEFSNLDGIDKLPKKFVEKLMEFELFNPALCAHTVCKYENRKHIKKKFVKSCAPIATMEEVIIYFIIL